MTKTQTKPQDEQEAPSAIEVSSARLVNMMQRYFESSSGGEMQFTDYERRLANHMHVKVDASLKAFEDTRLKRNQNNKAPFVWRHVNLEKFAIDGVHRIQLGLDALIPNHIHPVAYWNSKIEKYDIDLRIGYVGQDYCRRHLAVDRPLEVVYELVYDSDHFKALPRSTEREVEGYEFEITQPFSRGNPIGGFGYIVYEDPRKNKLVLVTQRDFDRAKSAAQTNDFWSKNDVEMMYKTVVHRVTSKIPIDPAKANAAAYAYVEQQENAPDTQVEAQRHANRELLDIDDGRTIDIEPAPQVAAAPEQPEPVPTAQTEGENGSLFDQADAPPPKPRF